MKIKRTLKARLSDAPQGLLGELKKARLGDLVYDHELTLSKVMRDDMPLDKVACFCFAEDGGDTQHPGYVVEAEEGDDGWVNFMLRTLKKQAPLEIDLYNACMSRCADWLVRSGVKELLLGAEERDITKLLSEESCKALLRWERECLRADPIGSGPDREHWYQFIVSCHQHQEQLDAQTLVQWLREDRGWRENYTAIIERVKENYVYSLGLLKFVESASAEHQTG
ncbi:MAG: hypothetical protein IJ228_05270 [Succinivibrio sp.]|nr:hypothetical protein [Succinivibrio sp.]